MDRNLQKLLKPRMLRRMAGVRSFERGEEYFAGGLVWALAEYKGAVTASVRGTREYQVRLWVENENLKFSCNCPIGTDGAFCKHCVAASLAWLEQADEALAEPAKSKGPATTIDDIRAYLARQDKNALVDMLMEQAINDDRMGQRLLLQAAKVDPKRLDLSSYRRAINQVVKTGGFVEYGWAHDYARRIEEVVDSIEELLNDGHAAEVLGLAEYALAAVEEAIESVDDSDGNMGGILERLQEIHYAACKKARPDPKALARRLFEWELSTDWDTFLGAAETYADILGKEGLALYRKLAEAEWARVRTIGPGGQDPDQYGKRFRITRIMETLARQSGDIEALVVVKKRDLSSAYAYLEIAEVYKQAGKRDLALHWAEQGVKAFPSKTDSRLREFLAQEYHRRQRHDEAMALMWAEYTESPSLQRYECLKRHADQIGQWPQWREKALNVMRKQIGRAKQEEQKNTWRWLDRPDHSELVRIFLWENDLETAWSEANEGGCSNDLWMELARKREKNHPENAIPIYQKQVESTLAQKNNEAYREAVGLLRKVHALMVHTKREAEFPGYVESVRLAHKAKRNFMKLLEQARWG